jgi:hypothetical protein
MKHFTSQERIRSEPTAAFLIGATIKVKLKARWYDSTSLFLFSVPMRNAAVDGEALHIDEKVSKL